MLPRLRSAQVSTKGSVTTPTGCVRDKDPACIYASPSGLERRILVILILWRQGSKSGLTHNNSQNRDCQIGAIHVA